MRIVAILMVLITLLVGVFFFYTYNGMRMEIEGVASMMTAAVDAIETYDGVRAQLANGSFYGQQFVETEFLMPDSFAFLTLTVRMRNPGILPMDWIRIEVEPDSADILQLPADRTPSLAAGTRGDFSTTLLTRTGASTLRRIIIHYYVLGTPLTVEHVMS